MDKNKWYTSGWAIALSMYFFFPVGLALLYLRLRENHGKYIAASKMLYWFGIIWGGLGLFYWIVSLPDPTFVTEYFPSGLVCFVIPGGICFYYGNKRKKKCEIYNKYIKYTKSRKSIEISTLCNLVYEDYDTTLKNITDMISKEIIDAYIENDVLIMNNNSLPSGGISYQSEIKSETKIVKCKSCGAKNTVIAGKTKECEYCGTLLQ